MPVEISFSNPKPPTVDCFVPPLVDFGNRKLLAAVPSDNFPESIPAHPTIRIVDLMLSKVRPYFRKTTNSVVDFAHNMRGEMTLPYMR